MKIQIVKYFKGGSDTEYGVYYVDNTLVIQHGDEYKAIFCFDGAPIQECLFDITDKIKMEIQEAVKIMKERVG